MFNKSLSAVFISLVFATLLMGDGTTVIIKVNGPFALINKGRNQGIQEGQIYFVKRQTGQGFADICKVKIFRTTANRAAVEQVKRTKKSLLQKGDKLFSNRDINTAMLKKSKVRSKQTGPVVRKLPPPISDPQPASEKQSQKSEKPIESGASADAGKVELKNINSGVKFRTYTHNLKKPWITFQGGVIIPNGDLAVAYSPSIMFGGSYMVEAIAGFNLGVEVNNTFFNALFGGGNLPGAASTSSTLLEAHVVLQRFFGKYFFVEGGGGIYRPKISTISVDDFKTTFSSTNFGMFGGTGFFVPTSEYAGIMLRGRLHTYFDQTKKQYFGLSGGFRFKVN